MKLSVIILAAGQGMRMKSNLPKVMHEVAGSSMLEHLLLTATRLEAQDIRVVASEELQADQCYQQLQKDYGFTTFLQKERLGTGHAVQSACDDDMGDITLVLYGDAPLITEATLMGLVQKLGAETPLSVLGFEASNPYGYGRLVVYGEQLKAIIEEKDADEVHKEITLCNSGIIAANTATLKALLPKISNNNASKEYYLTDVIALAQEDGIGCSYSIAVEQEVMGVNNKVQLALVENAMQRRIAERLMLSGVIIQRPETCYFDHRIEVGEDVTIEPHVYTKGRVKLGDGVRVRAGSYLEDCELAAGVVVGPYARLRPGTKLEEDVRIGNFVEVKKSHVGKGSKINHLTYVGDAKIGAKVNVGAGTVFCNYDGKKKHETHVDDGVFIGSNTSLVAPLKVGKEALIGAGSTITKDVEKGTLALGRAKQVQLKKSGG
jgi:bifunctional UDP-N-acetylglucosamine pyrophosphorylase/glucosamine-1-phosphate N-acetyltransferase